MEDKSPTEVVGPVEKGVNWLSDSGRGYRIAILGIVLYLILDIVAQALPPHYSPISQAESDLAVGPYGYVMTINFLNRGLLSLAFIPALAGTLRLSEGGLRRYRSGFFLLTVWSVGAILLAVFPTDVPSTPVSWHGAIHLVVAILAFLGGAFGALIVSLRLPKEGPLAPARRAGLPVAILSVVFCLTDLGAPFVAHHFSDHYGGLVERMFLASVLLWIGIVSAYMLSKDRGRPLDRPQAS